MPDDIVIASNGFSKAADQAKRLVKMKENNISKSFGSPLAHHSISQGCTAIAFLMEQQELNRLICK